MVDEKESRNAWKGLTAGLVGGLVASWTMEVFQSFWSEVSEAHSKAHKDDKPPGQQEGESQDCHQGAGDERRKEAQSGAIEPDPTTVRTAAAVIRLLFHHTLAQSEKRVAGAATHYSMGLVTGAVYGLASEYVPVVTVGAGVAWGAAVWMAADNLALPLLGLAKWPTSYPPGVHVYALSSHMVYGVTSELVRRMARQSL